MHLLGTYYMKGAEPGAVSVISLRQADAAPSLNQGDNSFQDTVTAVMVCATTHRETKATECRRGMLDIKREAGRAPRQKERSSGPAWSGCTIRTLGRAPGCVEK